MSKILVVDDAKNILLVLRMSLEKAGYEVITAMDGITALEKAQDLDPDLILLDILLPKMNGFLVFEALKDETTTAETPVIFISAKAEDEDLEKARELGAADFLIKPVKQEQLLETVEKYLEGGNENE